MLFRSLGFWNSVEINGKYLPFKFFSPPRILKYCTCSVHRFLWICQGQCTVFLHKDLKQVCYDLSTNKRATQKARYVKKKNENNESQSKPHNIFLFLKDKHSLIMDYIDQGIFFFWWCLYLCTNYVMLYLCCTYSLQGLLVIYIYKQQKKINTFLKITFNLIQLLVLFMTVK